MTTQETAEAFTQLLRENRHEEASRRYWAEDVVSLEAMPGDMARMEGAEAVARKTEWWVANHEVHDQHVEGPWCHGDQFAVKFRIEVTPKGGQRMTMEEIGLYTLRDGKIVEERFFYNM